MLKHINFLLKNCEVPDFGNLLPAVCACGMPDVADGELVVTDDENTMHEAKSRGLAIIFCSDGEKFVKGAEYVIESADCMDYEYANTAYCRMRGIPLTVLKTLRTVVREICVGDLEELYRIYDDDEVRRYVPPLMEYNLEKRYTESYIHDVYGLYGFGLWVVTERESGRLIGRAGISLRDVDGGERMELGYLIAREYRRKGYAYEVCSAIRDYAFGRLGADTLYIVTEPDNEASVRTAKKLGFGSPSFSKIKGCEYMIFQCKE